MAAIFALHGAIPAFAVRAHLDPEIHRVLSVELEDRSSPVRAYVEPEPVGEEMEESKKR